ncbi:MAG: DoxX family membrane protein, partial [Patescibacteria group bacterium]
AETFVIVNGIFEIFMASLLAFGMYTRPVAGLLFLHMFAIIADVGLSPIGIRDIGLMFALLSVTLFGQDEYSLKRDVAVVK